MTMIRVGGLGIVDLERVVYARFCPDSEVVVIRLVGDSAATCEFEAPAAEWEALRAVLEAGPATAAADRVGGRIPTARAGPGACR